MEIGCQGIKNKFFAKGITHNFLIAFIALILTWIFGGPRIDIEFKTAWIIFLILFIPYFFVIIFSVIARRSEATTKQSRKNTTGLLRRFTPHNDDLIFDPYKYIRHPACAAIIFLLNPAIAIIFRSWLYLLACVVIYFIWKSLAENEEVIMAKELGESYGQYRLDTNLFFPDLYSISRLLYFFFIGASVFIIVFVVLNFSALSFRYVGWRESGDLPTVNGPTKSAGNETAASLSRAEKLQAQKEIYDKPDSIVIAKIGVNAPLIYAKSTEQRELNQDLNNGVVIYPGSDPPGQIGNLFLTGHSSVYPWNKTIYGQVFAALDKLEIGDTVVIYFGGGAARNKVLAEQGFYLQQHKYEYKITNKYTAAPKNIRLVHPADEAKITLMTCWPIGTNFKRLIVEGVLTSN